MSYLNKHVSCPDSSLVQRHHTMAAGFRLVSRACIEAACFQKDPSQILFECIFAVGTTNSDKPTQSWWETVLPTAMTGESADFADNLVKALRAATLPGVVGTLQAAWGVGVGAFGLTVLLTWLRWSGSEVLNAKIAQKFVETIGANFSPEEQAIMSIWVKAALSTGEAFLPQVHRGPNGELVIQRAHWGSDSSFSILTPQWRIDQCGENYSITGYPASLCWQGAQVIEIKEEGNSTTRQVSITLNENGQACLTGKDKGALSEAATLLGIQQPSLESQINAAAALIPFPGVLAEAVTPSEISTINRLATLGFQHSTVEGYQVFSTRNIELTNVGEVLGNLRPGSVVGMGERHSDISTLRNLVEILEAKDLLAKAKKKVIILTEGLSADRQFETVGVVGMEDQKAWEKAMRVESETKVTQCTTPEDLNRVEGWLKVVVSDRNAAFLSALENLEKVNKASIKIFRVGSAHLLTLDAESFLKGLISHFKGKDIVLFIPQEIPLITPGVLDHCLMMSAQELWGLERHPETGEHYQHYLERNPEDSSIEMDYARLVYGFTPVEGIKLLKETYDRSPKTPFYTLQYAAILQRYGTLAQLKEGLEICTDALKEIDAMLKKANLPPALMPKFTKTIASLRELKKAFIAKLGKRSVDL